MKQRESRLEAWCVRYATTRGALVFKLRPPPRGVPDRIFILPNGKVLWIEFKSPKGKVSGPQAAVITALRVLGQVVEVVRDRDGFTNLYPAMVML